jgi:acyl-CoA thioesterase II
MADETQVLLGLDQIDELVFRGHPTQAVPTRIFGGQLVAQALIACGRTVGDGRPVHSVHSYFLRPGRPDLSIEYRVESLREGRTLSTRQVTASQDDRAVFQLSASFHEPESGVAHQLPSVHGLDVDRVPDFSQQVLDVDEQSRRWFAGIRAIFPFEIRFPEEPVRLAVKRNERPAPRQRLFLRWPKLASDDPLVHAGAVAFMSDALLLSTSLFPHGRLFDDPDVSGSSLDHAIWFHRDVRADDWLLYAMESTWAGGARALCTGHLFERSGELVATVMQEGLVRIDEPLWDTPPKRTDDSA